MLVLCLPCHCRHLGRGQGWLWASLSQQAGAGNVTRFSFFVWNHCRTLEYLIKHLTHLASFSNMTNMHTRNLALVWAPNLLRYGKDFLLSRAPCWAPRGVADLNPMTHHLREMQRQGKAEQPKGEHSRANSFSSRLNNLRFYCQRPRKLVGLCVSY